MADNGGCGRRLRTDFRGRSRLSSPSARPPARSKRCAPCLAACRQNAAPRSSWSCIARRATKAVSSSCCNRIPSCRCDKSAGTTSLEPGCVLVIPPGMHVSAIDSHLRITAPADAAGPSAGRSTTSSVRLPTLMASAVSASCSRAPAAMERRGCAGSRIAAVSSSSKILRKPSTTACRAAPSTRVSSISCCRCGRSRAPSSGIAARCRKRSTRVPPTARSASFVRCSRAARDATSACIERRS